MSAQAMRIIHAILINKGILFPWYDGSGDIIIIGHVNSPRCQSVQLVRG